MLLEVVLSVSKHALRVTERPDIFSVRQEQQILFKRERGSESVNIRERERGGGMQMQMQMQSMMAAYYPGNVTTDHIQQYLDENKSLILKIVESQNSGKMNECAENQARLQRNLMYLAAIADSQPQPPTMHSQYPSGSMLGGHYIQQQQQQQQAQSLMAARSSMLYGAQAYPTLQQQAMHSQLGMSSGGSSSVGLMLQGEPHTSGGGFPDFIRGDGMQRGMGSGSGEGRDGGETSLYLKSSDQDGH